MIIPSHIQTMDADDPLGKFRKRFDLSENIIYLDGNSLGPVLSSVKTRVAETLAKEWGESLIRAWNDHDWIDMPRRVGRKIAPIIGAEPENVLCADSTSINILKCVSAAVQMRPGRKVILSEQENFPTDLYVGQGLATLLAQGYEMKILPRAEVLEALDETVAVLMLTHVDYRTAHMHDMKAVTAKAHEAGALMLWDLAHSAGAVKLDVADDGADFAVGCGYKYFNGGPGAPAFIYAAPHILKEAPAGVFGWLGHDAPFAFETGYRPADGIARYQVGTPPILSMAALDEALGIWSEMALEDVFKKSKQLSALFEELVQPFADELGLTLASPNDPDMRGSHLSYAHANAYAVVQALISRGVIGDFRAPDLIRLGFCPLYNSFEDIYRAASHLEDVLRTEEWRREEFSRRQKVT